MSLCIKGRACYFLNGSECNIHVCTLALSNINIARRLSMEFLTALTYGVTMTIILVWAVVTFLLWRSPLVKRVSQPEKVESKEIEDDEDNVIIYH